MPPAKSRRFGLLPVRGCLFWVLAAAMLRLAPMAWGSIWFDEIVSIKIASYSLPGIVYRDRFDPSPPLFYLLLHFGEVAASWLGAWAQSFHWLRLESAICSIATCLVLYGWMRQHRGRRAAQFALAFAALSPGLVFYGQELRDYALVMFFVALMGCCAVNLMIRPGLFWAFGFVAGGVGQIYSHNLTAPIIAANFLFMAAIPKLAGHRADLRLRLYFYAVWAVLIAVGLSRVGPVLGQYQRSYSVLENQLPPVPSSDLLAALLFAFPAGPVEGQNWSTPYGIIASYLACLVMALIFIGRRLASRQFDPASAASLSGAYCIFISAFFLLTTYAATMAGMGHLFSSDRLAMIILPLWIFWAALAIDRLRPARWRMAARAAVLLLTIPATFLTLRERTRLRHEFNELNSQNDLADGPGITKMHEYAIADERLAPWLRHPAPRIMFRTLNPVALLQEKSSKPLQIVDYLLLNDTIPEDDRETITLAYLRYWAMITNSPPRPATPLKVYTVRPEQRINFLEGLQAFTNRAAAQVVRARDRLVLFPFCEDFSTARGFYEPEVADQSIFRWTRGTDHALFFQAPEVAGRYRLSVHLTRPRALPSPRMTIDFKCARDPQERHITAETGEVILEEPLVTRSLEPIEFDFTTDYFIPNQAIKGSGDLRQLSLIFNKLEISPLGDHPALR